MKFHRNQLLIYAVTDRAWTKGRSLCGQVEEALKGGATMVQFREKGLDRGIMTRCWPKQWNSGN